MKTKKMLIVPMAAMAETAGSFSRAAILAGDLHKAGMAAALCAAEDINSKPVPGVGNYPLSVPMPLGLPAVIAVHLFPIAQKSGITSRKTVNSFEDVLQLTGNTDYRYLSKSIPEIRRAIQEYEPDAVYSEFNISAIIAAKLEGKRLFVSASVPTQYEYSGGGKFSGGTNRILRELHLPAVESVLELFSWADMRFVPSCYELEPFTDKRVVFCGTWRHDLPAPAKKRDKVLVYMGNGTISQRKMIREVRAAFRGTACQVYIAGKGLRPQETGNIHIAPYVDFLALLPETALFINHGGQNSVADGLIFGVPQIICAGKVFERKYNAGSIEKNHAGIELPGKDFSAEAIRSSAHKLLSNPQYRDNAAKLGNTLLSLGGTDNIIQALRG